MSHDAAKASCPPPSGRPPHAGLAAAESRLPALAWQPLTPRGVAAFAQARSGRLLLVQGLVALLTAGIALWFLSTTWFPAVRQAIGQLPKQGAIRGRQLITPLTTATLLTQNSFLALVVDATERNDLVPHSDFSVHFRQSDLAICSLLGCVNFRYPGKTVPFNRPELESWWGAWEPILLGLTAAGLGLGWPLLWGVLATLYAPAVRLWAYFRDRRVNLRDSWRLAGAALIPGALLLDVGIVFYGLGLVDLVRLSILIAGHFVIGWVYLIVSPLYLPSVSAPAASVRNPFVAAPPDSASRVER